MDILRKYSLVWNVPVTESTVTNHKLMSSFNQLFTVIFTKYSWVVYIPIFAMLLGSIYFCMVDYKRTWYLRQRRLEVQRRLLNGFQLQRTENMQEAHPHADHPEDNSDDLPE